MAEINNHPEFEFYWQQLIREAKGGNLEAIKELAKKIPGLLNAVRQEEGHTVLHAAAVMERSNVVEWLLSDEGRAAGFNNVLARMKGDMTALDVAVWTGNLECFKAVVYGCKVENGEREQMLNAADDQRMSILHYAVIQGRPTIVKWLLSDEKGGGREAGFNNIFPSGDIQDFTALHEAADRGDLECFVAIVEGCKVENGERAKMLNALDGDDSTVLHIAARHNHPSIIKWLLSKGRDLGFTSILVKDDDIRTALHVAAQEGHLEACKAIAEGCIVETGEREEVLNETNYDDCTVLNFAADHGHTSVVSWLLSDDEGGGRALGFKSTFARTYNDGRTALHTAAQHGQLEACKAILKGCKVDNGEREQMLKGVDEHGLTVLHYAASFGHPDIVSWLLSHDADGGRAQGLNVDLMTKDSKSALHCVAQSGSVETLRALLSGCTVGERLKMFLAVDDKGWTPLHYASRCCQQAIIREFLLHHEETKMIADHRDLRGMTALHRVALNGGLDEESRREWNRIFVRLPLAPREEVVAALLTYKYSDDDEEEGQGQAASSSTKKGSKKRRRQEEEDDDDEQEEEEEEEQAACIDVNLGLKIE